MCGTVPLIALRPLQNTPFIDDWTYAWSVEHLLTDRRGTGIGLVQQRERGSCPLGRTLQLAVRVLLFSALRFSTWAASLLALLRLHSSPPRTRGRRAGRRADRHRPAWLVSHLLHPLIHLHDRRAVLDRCDLVLPDAGPGKPGEGRRRLSSGRSCSRPSRSAFERWVSSLSARWCLTLVVHPNWKDQRLWRLSVAVMPILGVFPAATPCAQVPYRASRGPHLD